MWRGRNSHYASLPFCARIRYPQDVGMKGPEFRSRMWPYAPSGPYSSHHSLSAWLIAPAAQVIGTACHSRAARQGLILRKTYALHRTDVSGHISNTPLGTHANSSVRSSLCAGVHPQIHRSASVRSGRRDGAWRCGCASPEVRQRASECGRRPSNVALASCRLIHAGISSKFPGSPPCHQSRYAGLLALVLIVVAICGVWTARAPLLRGAAALWVVSDPPSPADAVVILGGRIDLRPFAAAEIYKRGLAKKVLIADVEPGPLDELRITLPDSELTRAVLIKLGVPADAIAPFGQHVSSTYDEARALVAWAVASGAKRVIVPTDLFHTRRVKWLFARELSRAGVDVDVPALTPRDYTLADWWRNEAGLIAFNNEVIKYFFYRIKYWHADPFIDGAVGR